MHKMIVANSLNKGINYRRVNDFTNVQTEVGAVVQTVIIVKQMFEPMLKGDERVGREFLAEGAAMSTVFRWKCALRVQGKARSLYGWG